MVMESYGVSVPEATIRVAANCDDGTYPSDLAEAAIHFGFHLTQYFLLQTPLPAVLGELQAMLAQGYFPIVFVKEWPHLLKHAVIILASSDQGLLVLDPIRGERTINQNQFEEAWTRALRELILVQR